MTPNENKLLEALRMAGVKGLSPTGAAKKAKIPVAKIDACLSDLRSKGLLLGPITKGKAKYYFEAAHAPSSAKAQAEIENILLGSGVKLTSRQKLEEELKGFLKPFLRDALSVLKSEGRIVEFKQTNNAIVYAHRDPILERLQVGNEPASKEDSGPQTPSPRRTLTLEDVHPAYEKLKAQQGGISVVKIYDLLAATGVARDDLHHLLREEARRGRVSLHPATTVNFPPEVIEAGIRIEGERDPRVTVVFKEGMFGISACETDLAS
jgi:hypothetical protein